MKRQYTREEFEHIVEFLKDKVPHITIATDIICGFPGETELEFQESLDLVQKHKFPALYISQFYPRYGTPAAKMKRVATKEVKKRSRLLTKLFDSYTTRDHKLGQIFNVLITEIAADGINYVAHNKFYDQVIIQPNGENLFGKYVKVKIYATGKHYLKGKIISFDLTPEIDVKKEQQIQQNILNILKKENEKKNDFPKKTKSGTSVKILKKKKKKKEKKKKLFFI